MGPLNGWGLPLGYMPCETCGVVSDGPFNRINPEPWDELIVCDHCYEWEAWRFCEQKPLVGDGVLQYYSSRAYVPQ